MSFWLDTKDVFSGRRSLGNVVKSKIVGYRTIRVALMGSRESGKTVFLAALENHLREHSLHPEDFPLGGRIIDWYKHALSGKKEIYGIPRFEYQSIREQLQKGEWPEKTMASSILAMRLGITDRKGKQEDVQLEIVDVPGERIADFAMRGRSYRQWSRWLEEESSADYQAYLRKVKEAGPVAREDLFSAYRDFIAEEYKSYAPCITPSTVKLGLDGKARGGDPDLFRQAINGVPVGFTDRKGKVWEFLPLPEQCFDEKSWRKLISEFEKSYTQYVKKVVRPVADWMEGAEKLIYLVDMLSLLQAGGEACAAERQYGEAAIGALCSKKSDGVLNRMGKWAKNFLWNTHIHSVYIVATKGDCVWSSQNRDNLATLAKDLFRGTTQSLDRGVKCGAAIPCAAVCTTKERQDGTPGLEGKILDPRQPDSMPILQRWIPSNVPDRLPGSSEEWDARIAAGEFNYHIAFPAFDPARICPPKHINLNLIVEAILDRK